MKPSFHLFACPNQKTYVYANRLTITGAQPLTGAKIACSKRAVKTPAKMPPEKDD